MLPSHVLLPMAFAREKIATHCVLRFALNSLAPGAAARTDRRTRKPAIAIRITEPGAAIRPIIPTAAREQLDIPRAALLVKRALISGNGIIRPGAEIGRIIVAITLIAQPLVHHPAAVLEAEVADHPPAGGVDMAAGGDRIDAAGDIGLLVAAFGHDLELAIIQHPFAYREQIVDMVVPYPRVGDRAAEDAGRRRPGTALQVDINPQLGLIAPGHPGRRAGRAVSQVPHRHWHNIAGQKPGQRMVADGTDIEALAVEAAKFHTVINCVPYRCGSIRTKGNSSRR